MLHAHLMFQVLVETTMNNERNIVIALAFVFGFAGGLVGSKAALVAAPAPGVIRAPRFELIDSKGKAVATWTEDGTKGTSLQFLGVGGREV